MRYESKNEVDSIGKEQSELSRAVALASLKVKIFATAFQSFFPHREVELGKLIKEKNLITIHALSPEIHEQTFEAYLSDEETQMDT